MSDVAPRRLDAVEAVYQVALVSLRRSLRGGRPLLLVALVVLPGIIAYTAGNGGPDARQEHLLYELLAFYHFGIAMPATALVLATAFPWPESDDGTLTYWFTSPVRRWTVHLGRMVAALLIGSTALCLAASAVALPLNPSPAVDVAGPLRTSLTATLLAFPAYLGVFSLLATITRRGLVVGLVFMLIENSVGLMPGGNINRLTGLLYVRSLLHPTASDVGRAILEERAGVAEPATASTAVAVFLIVTTVTVLTALLLVERIEYRGKHAQPG